MNVSNSRPVGISPRRRQALPDQSHGMKILLVEDDRDTLYYLSLILRLNGHEVITAASLAEARAVAVQERFHLLISDIELPDGSGLELMGELGGGGVLPGLALSGFDSKEDVELSR